MVFSKLTSSQVVNRIAILFCLAVTLLCLPFLPLPGGSATATELLGVTLFSVFPEEQRVHERITLRGSGFGQYTPGISEVLFFSDLGQGQPSVAPVPYVWRDTFIQVQVPVGQRINGVNTPTPRSINSVKVVSINGESNPVPFRLVTSLNTVLSFTQKTLIVQQGGALCDVTTFLGNPNLNAARTKDADIGDIDGDGYMDIIDNNSWNVQNTTNSIIRFNRDGVFFSTMKFEPRNNSDVGVFAATIPPGGDYMVNMVTYDSDLVDLNSDELPDYVQASSQDGGEPGADPDQQPPGGARKVH